MFCPTPSVKRRHSVTSQQRWDENKYFDLSTRSGAHMAFRNDVLYNLTTTKKTENVRQ